MFRVTPNGTLTSLYTFCSQRPGCTSGAGPYAGLVLGTDGNFYGTTPQDGASGNGTVFKITSAGALSTLYSFCSQPGCADGAGPYFGLVPGADGNFYGTTEGGGANNYGTVFKITSGGTLTTLHSFDRTDGMTPAAVLVQATDGSFYGTTPYGGATTACGGFFQGCGTVFKITSDGTLTTLYSSRAMTATGPRAGWFRAPTGTSTGQPPAAGPAAPAHTAAAPSSKSPPAAP